ncbi:response regulator [Pedobacter hiemivivus]|jgi:CheY-like chemotaxis protein|uniref:Response regulator n=1 Tax=Pedobacter hiemivivus TaxID=2530454 RepID=A0A4U1GF75_9SPHI|nr:response regulator [Pedobacter hiemivivus]TCC88347.1 response regulator [Pedobacter hiemivivus]TKC59942.1 response regulator [Pedobacter hiemivivus]
MMDNKINLLVIDDDDINIFIIKKIVEKTGYNVNMVAKANGLLAIEHLKATFGHTDFPQLILIDINMPVLNGWEFLDAYEALNVTKKVDMYMLSSSVYENDIEKAKTYAKVKGFISKPLSIERLIELFKLLA